jgi:hypothetical protein
MKSFQQCRLKVKEEFRVNEIGNGCDVIICFGLLSSSHRGSDSKRRTEKE